MQGSITTVTDRPTPGYLVCNNRPHLHTGIGLLPSLFVSNQIKNLCYRLKGLKCIIVLNFIAIQLKVSDLWRFNVCFLFKVAAVRHLVF